MRTRFLEPTTVDETPSTPPEVGARARKPSQRRLALKVGESRGVKVSTRRSLAAALFTALLGCAAPLQLAEFDDAQPTMRPEQFFAGTTEGWGVLSKRDGRPSRKFEVRSEGRTEADGRFRLEQTLTFADGEVEQRVWLITRVDETHYKATLSNAIGPVRAEVHGNLFHLEYLHRRPSVVIEQWLYLMPDGRTVLNVGTVKVLGRPFLRMSERIVRVDDE